MKYAVMVSEAQFGDDEACRAVLEAYAAADGAVICGEMTKRMLVEPTVEGLSMQWDDSLPRPYGIVEAEASPSGGTQA